MLGNPWRRDRVLGQTVPASTQKGIKGSVLGKIGQLSSREAGMPYYNNSPYSNPRHIIDWQRLQQDEENLNQVRLLLLQEQQDKRDLAFREKNQRRQQRHRREHDLAELAMKTYKFTKEHPEVIDLAKDLRVKAPEALSKMWDAARKAGIVKPAQAASSDGFHSQQRTGRPTPSHSGGPSNSTSRSSHRTGGDSHNVEERPSNSTSTGPASSARPSTAESGIKVTNRDGVYSTAVPPSGERGVNVIRNPDGTYRG
jgi:hypothetical protein